MRRRRSAQCSSISRRNPDVAATFARSSSRLSAAFLVAADVARANAGISLVALASATMTEFRTSPRSASLLLRTDASVDSSRGPKCAAKPFTRFAAASPSSRPGPAPTASPTPYPRPSRLSETSPAALVWRSSTARLMSMAARAATARRRRDPFRGEKPEQTLASARR